MRENSWGTRMNFEQMVSGMIPRRLRKNLEVAQSIVRGRQPAYKHRDFLLSVAQAQPAAVFELLDGHRHGLTPDQVEERQTQYGPNSVAHEAARWQTQLRRALINPFNILLAVLAGVSFATNDVKGTITLAAMVIISVSLTFIQEFRSSRAAENLKKMVQTRATVNRKIRKPDSEDADDWISSRQELLIEEIVPGDIVILSAGDMIPADVRLLTSKDLFVSQSAMTGESIPVEKMAPAESATTKNVLELANICFMGTNVVSGTATAIVVKTGAERSSVASPNPSRDFEFRPASKGGESIFLADDSVHAGDGPFRFPRERFHQRELDGGLHVRRCGSGGPCSGNAPDDRDREFGQGRDLHVAQKSYR